MPDSACPGPIATRQFLIKPHGMQPHSREESRAEAFVSYEVQLVFESCIQTRSRQDEGLQRADTTARSIQGSIIIAYAQPNPVLLQRILPACYP